MATQLRKNSITVQNKHARPYLEPPSMAQPHVEAFRRLRPACVELSQVALKRKAKGANAIDVIKSLESLQTILRSVASESDALNPKLADYVFFPLSHIFRDLKDLPVRAVEVAVLCLQILIQDGWKTQLPGEMGRQLLILLCFVVGGNANESTVKRTQEDLAHAVFTALTLLFRYSLDAGLTQSGTIKDENVPILGHAVVVFLDGMTDGQSDNVRLSATEALKSLVEGIPDDVALRNVFPGITSTLTKILSGKATHKSSSKGLVLCLKTFKTLLHKVMKDSEIDKASEESALELTTVDRKTSERRNWLAATTAQVKMALANIFSLRNHESLDVRLSLLQLCLTIFKECRASLSASLPMAVETAVVICSQPAGLNDAIPDVKTTLITEPSLVDMLKVALHDWLVSLPRMLQSNDDLKKSKAIRQVSTAFLILGSVPTNIDVLQATFAQSLMSSVSNISLSEISPGPRSVTNAGIEIRQLLQRGRTVSDPDGFAPVLLDQLKDRPLSQDFEALFEGLAYSPMVSLLQQDILSTLKVSDGHEQVACLWLSLKLLKAKSSERDLVDRYMKFSVENLNQNEFLDSVYSIALDVLSRSTFEDEERWKLQALSLEAVALQAFEQGHEFRPELVDALYPILERLGSSNSKLQNHAISCLDFVSKACEYDSPVALIIDNADYLINAVSLKMNTFSISPQAPQVLVMIIRLCGAPLIPYLDDTIESIFAILACYHGYPRLAESLFSILNAIVDETSKASSNTIDFGPKGISKPHHYQPMTMTALAAYLRTFQSPTVSRSTSPEPQPEPVQPSTSGPASIEKDQEQDPNDENAAMCTTPPRSSSPPPAPQSKILTLLSHITQSAEPHLTSPSASLRISLLNLLSTSLPTLAASDANEYLPISATLFPLVSTRLLTAGEEPPVILAAAETMRVLCECSGDFLSSKIGERDWWSRLMRLWQRAEEETREEVRIQGKGRKRNLHPRTHSRQVRFHHQHQHQDPENSPLELTMQKQQLTPNSTPTPTSSKAKAKIATAVERSGRGGAGGKGLWTRIFNALIDLIVTILADVGVNGEKEDQCFEILTPLVLPMSPSSPAAPRVDTKGKNNGSSSNKNRSNEIQRFDLLSDSEDDDVNSVNNNDNINVNLKNANSVLNRRQRILKTLELVNADTLWLYQETARGTRQPAKSESKIGEDEGEEEN